ncbi:MAG: hypothetical protein ABEH81_01395 [Halopenitus sp.]
MVSNQFERSGMSMFRKALFGAGVSLLVGGLLSWFLVYPFVVANSPSEWVWALGPLSILLTTGVVFGVGWFFTILFVMEGEF